MEDRDPGLFSEYCGEAGADDPDGYVRWLEPYVRGLRDTLLCIQMEAEEAAKTARPKDPDR